MPKEEKLHLVKIVSNNEEFFYGIIFSPNRYNIQDYKIEQYRLVVLSYGFTQGNAYNCTAADTIEGCKIQILEFFRNATFYEFDDIVDMALFIATENMVKILR